ncbi:MULTISPECIES: ABC transporter permease subunit [Agrobacterium]|uniref:ABC transporter permease subunit n=1 Tax=Agrobacterium tumefaciens TaxID=358 RepID=A0AAE6BBL1_AGRTU|nr:MULTISPECIES: ABC transporter permease subunit [Agrobacterium]QCL74354.1 ABC transporter permease subunit [Agrobacterium tumefaciens]QCL79931.1 ABC transporter permease subunit [Agrobacterium tumefaciens]CUX28657.1 Binding-protein-dependent transport systems inner membrane component [Agrobacterium sp. NCPPB 925]
MNWRGFFSRYVLLQALYVGSFAALFLSAVLIARQNLQEQGIGSGFDFLWKSAGWDMAFSLFPTTSNDPYWWVLLMGFLNTLLTGVMALLLATALGGAIGTMRISPIGALRFAGTAYVELFRNIPLIVQLSFWYMLASRLPAPRNSLEISGIYLNNRGLYLPTLNISSWTTAAIFGICFSFACFVLCFKLSRRARTIQHRHRWWVITSVTTLSLLAIMLVLMAGHNPQTPIFNMPQLKGLNFSGGYRLQPELYILILAIALYAAAYVGEIVRGGFLAVGRGQMEAAQALGLTAWQGFTRIRLPLALKSMLPILTNQYIWLIKATTLGIVVGFTDFFMVIATAITQSGQTLEMVGLLMAGFLLINASLATILNRVNDAIAIKGHQLRS